jgi:hypothetical protein
LKCRAVARPKAKVSFVKVSLDYFLNNFFKQFARCGPEAINFCTS